MAAGDAFTMVPTSVITEEPVYNNVESPTETQKKEYFNVAATPIQRYRLEFMGKTHAERQAIINHFNDQYGSYHNFSWQSVPSYINSGANITGRWVKGTYKESPVGSKWRINISFEKEN